MSKKDTKVSSIVILNTRDFVHNSENKTFELKIQNMDSFLNANQLDIMMPRLIHLVSQLTEDDVLFSFSHRITDHKSNQEIYVYCLDEDEFFTFPQLKEYTLLIYETLGNTSSNN